jgi:hypothetical protein
MAQSPGHTEPAGPPLPPGCTGPGEAHMPSSWFQPPSAVMLYGQGTLKVSDVSRHDSVCAPTCVSILPCRSTAYPAAASTLSMVAFS